MALESMMRTAQELAHPLSEPEMQSVNVGSAVKNPRVSVKGLGALGTGWKY